MRYVLAVVSIALLVLLGEVFGYLRGAIALLMFVGIALFGARYLQFLVAAPPDPEPVDVSGYGLRYVCRMCGLELKVEVAAKEKAPTHCMEPMELVAEDGNERLSAR